MTAHILPWNTPMQIVGRSISAALAALDMGNACVLKPPKRPARRWRRTQVCGGRCI